MVNVKFRACPDGRMVMVVKGHAHFAPKGEDLVCAAVSVLVHTAAQAVQAAGLRGKLQEEPVILLKEGYALICAKPRVRYRASAGQIFRTVRCGMEALAGQFPDYVRLSGNV